MDLYGKDRTSPAYSKVPWTLPDRTGPLWSCPTVQGRSLVLVPVGTIPFAPLCLFLDLAVSHFDKDPAAIGTVRMEEGSHRLAVSPDEPEGKNQCLH